MDSFSLRSLPLVSRKGQSLVEFALTIPVFLVMVFGAIDVCRFYFQLEQMTHLLRAGVRQAVVYRTDDSGNTLTRRAYLFQQINAVNAVDNALPLVMPSTTVENTATDDIVMTPNDISSPASHDTNLRVEMKLPFTFITPFLNEIASAYTGLQPYQMKVVINSRVEP